MNQQSETYKELSAISPLLARQARVNPFSVPDQYFETNAAVLFDVSTSIEPLSNGLLSAHKDTTHLDLPEGYFEQFPDAVLKRIQQAEAETGNQELNTLSPLIASIPKRNVFTISATYFDEAPQAILKKTIHKQKAREVSFRQRFTWNHLAAAATLIFMITFGALYLLKQNEVSGDAVLSAAMQIQTDEQFETLLAQVNETDLIQYLQISTDIKDAETIRSMVNSDALPDETEYLNTDFTDTFISNMEINGITNN